jgi:hypothetical protein
VWHADGAELVQRVKAMTLRLCMDSLRSGAQICTGSRTVQRYPMTTGPEESEVLASAPCARRGYTRDPDLAGDRVEEVRMVSVASVSREGD